MSPSLALQSPVFWCYMALVVGLLTASGLLLGVLRFALGKPLAHAERAYFGWLIMAPLLLGVYFLGREAVIAFLAAVAAVGFREFARASGLSRDRALSAAVYLAIGGGAALILVEATPSLARAAAIHGMAPALAVAALVAIAVVRNRPEGQLSQLSLAVLGYIYFGWMFGHLSLAANSRYAYAYLGYVVAAVELNDVAAYTFGKLFGRRPLCRHTSPGKTLEGALGALAVSCLLPWALWWTLPHFTAADCMAVGLIVGVGGILGDLVVSLIKRDLRVKDMGSAIPGHGGILDRIDSLILVAPLFFHYVRYRFEANPLS